MGGGQEAAASTGLGASPGRAQRVLIRQGLRVSRRKQKQGQREGAEEDGEDLFRFPKAKELYKEEPGKSLPISSTEVKTMAGP